jgi:Xaa-Pro dipeptidase|tara:strand:- start:129 stop:473 length:345 start_codon:yes stop_codon:yes gene_type:complete
MLGDKPSRIGIESNLIPTIFQNMLSETYPGTALDDISLVLDQRRMIKSDAEIDVMRQTGKISGAMMQAAEGSLSVRAPEYESALALINSITQKATDFLNTKGLDAFISSLIHNL